MLIYKENFSESYFCADLNKSTIIFLTSYFGSIYPLSHSIIEFDYRFR
nr:MAG TPA: hypothetical protein [Caudoviricetes sp.]